MQTTPVADRGVIVDSALPNNEDSFCLICGSRRNLLRCSRCREAMYCGKDHQRQDWDRHKRRCRVVSGTQTKPSVSSEGSSEMEVLSSCEQSLSSGSTMPQFVPERAVWPQLPAADGRLPYMHSTLQDRTDDPFREICSLVVADMNRYGICVLDDFLGTERALLVLHDFLRLYKAGEFQDGQLVKGKERTESKTIRGDQIMWSDGKSPESAHIGYLIQQMDGIIMRANRMSNNGEMGEYVINERTKAMLACYPGSGSHYVKHIDNPNKDGRCITAIYYLNKDWDTRTLGGLLRIFPTGWIDQVADIAPVFDRILFFWSDHRNPHEVQPAYSTRYAITLWYFDAVQREEAIKRFKEAHATSTSKDLASVAS